MTWMDWVPMQAQARRDHMSGGCWQISAYNEHSTIMLSSATDCPNSYSLFRGHMFKKTKANLHGSWWVLYECASESHPMSTQQEASAAIYQLTFINWLTNLLLFLEQPAMNVITRQGLKIWLSFDGKCLWFSVQKMRWLNADFLVLI